jgi:hypothetical protein
MRHPNPNRSLYLGMREGDLAGKPYAAFWNPRLAPLPERAKEALLHGPVAAPLLLQLADAPRLLETGDHELEDGYGFHPDGGLHVAVRTEMPGVSPAMVDWWFGWHSAEPQRYKLWHPRSHVHAQWGSPDSPELATKKGRERYVGRVSFVDEYLGSQMSHLAIRFLPPSELGFNEEALSDPERSTAVCARTSFAGAPLDVGYLIHHVRRVEGGSEMRSRFWIGGPHAFVRAGHFLDAIVTPAARRIFRPSAQNGRDLLVHCSQEMSHLATFLPRLYSELHDVP